MTADDRRRVHRLRRRRRRRYRYRCRCRCSRRGRRRRPNVVVRLGTTRTRTGTSRRSGGADKSSSSAAAASDGTGTDGRRRRGAGSGLGRGSTVPVPQLRHEAHVLLVEGGLLPRLVRLLLGLVEETVSRGVGGVPAERAADLDRGGTSLRALGTLELAVPLLPADVAVVFLPVHIEFSCRFFFHAVSS